MAGLALDAVRRIIGVQVLVINLLGKPTAGSVPLEVGGVGDEWLAEPNNRSVHVRTVSRRGSLRTTASARSSGKLRGRRSCGVVSLWNFTGEG